MTCLAHHGYENSPRSGRWHKAWGVSPRIGREKWPWACGAGDSWLEIDRFVVNGCSRDVAYHTAAARFAGSLKFQFAYLGFRCAPPQALCRRPLRGLVCD